MDKNICEGSRAGEDKPVAVEKPSSEYDAVVWCCLHHPQVWFAPWALKHEYGMSKKGYEALSFWQVSQRTEEEWIYNNPVEEENEYVEEQNDQERNVYQD